MPFDERKTFAATKEDLEQNTPDLPVVMQRQVPVIQKAQRMVDVPLLQYIATTVDVPVAKQLEDCMSKHNEIEMDKKLRSAHFRTESKKQIVFDSEGPRNLRFGIRCKQGSRVVRCVTGAARAAHRGAQHRRSCASSVSQSESSYKSSMCQVVKQRQVLTIQTVPRTVEVPQVEFLN